MGKEKGNETTPLVSFVKRFKWNPLIMGILLSARSVRQLERLHRQLPDKRRLLREDVVALGNAWKALNPDYQNPSGTDGPNQDLLFFTLQEIWAAEDKNPGRECRYRILSVARGRKIYGVSFNPKDRLHAIERPHGAGYGVRAYTTTLSGKYKVGDNVYIWAGITHGKPDARFNPKVMPDKIVVSFHWAGIRLDEPTCHFIREKMPDAPIEDGIDWSPMHHSHSIALVYFLPGEKLMPLLETNEPDWTCPFRATPQFLEGVVNGLKEQGLELSDLVPVTPRD